MNAENQPTSILCGGGFQAEASIAGLQSGCSVYAMLCGNRECQCMPRHRKHAMQLLDGLREELITPPKLTGAYTKAVKSINGLIDSCAFDLQQLKYSITNTSTDK
jgi:hypothetical protein